jgi:hypothetical protein
MSSAKLAGDSVVCASAKSALKAGGAMINVSRHIAMIMPYTFRENACLQTKTGYYHSSRISVAWSISISRGVVIARSYLPRKRIAATVVCA